MRERDKTRKRNDNREQHGEADPVRIQIHVTVQRPIRGGKPIQPTQALLDEAIRRFIDTGDTEPIKGITISAILWENYGRNKAELSAEDPESIEEARTSLRLPAMLRARGISFFRVLPMGSNRRTGT